MCKVSSGCVQWDRELLPQHKTGELGRELEAPCVLTNLGTHSSPLCLQSLTVWGLDSMIYGGLFQPIQFCGSVWYYKGKGIHTLASSIVEAYILSPAYNKMKQLGKRRNFQDAREKRCFVSYSKSSLGTRLACSLDTDCNKWIVSLWNIPLDDITYTYIWHILVSSANPWVVSNLLYFSFEVLACSYKANFWTLKTCKSKNTFSFSIFGLAYILELAYVFYELGLSRATWFFSS